MPRVNKDVSIAKTYNPCPYGFTENYNIEFKAKEQKYYLQTNNDEKELDKDTAQLIAKLMRLSKEEGKREVQGNIVRALGLDE